jgi:hypothetical protein
MERSPEPDDEFLSEVRSTRHGIFAELWGFLRENKKWWLTPILFVLLLAGLLVVLSSTGVAPFIYTLF